MRKQAVPTPRCPLHVGRPMALQSEPAVKKYGRVQQSIWNRWRCNVPGCPQVETTVKLHLSKFQRKQMQRIGGVL
jgi:hypothetical protein